jgi:hypothetical protein
MGKLLSLCGVMSLMAALGSASSLAEPVPLDACTPRMRNYLNRTIREVETEKYEVLLMKNGAGRVVGMYAWGKGDEAAQAEVCSFDQSNPEITAASNWFYWDHEQGSQDPRTWKVGQKLSIYQDEGYLHLEVLQASPSGKIKAKIEIEGVGEFPENDPRNIVAVDTVEFSKN